MSFKIYIPDTKPVGTFVNIRDTGGAVLGNDIGNLEKGQVGYGDEILGTPDGQYYCLRITSGATLGWAYGRFNWSPTNAIIEEVVAPPADTVTVEIYRDGVLIQTGEVDEMIAQGILSGVQTIDYQYP